ncbi:FtsW/RodA/SpoVE family cell cycle protein [Blastococcus sp. MG754426]|uniref:FtsW/RodA/SpoVE family cell cycle protein n=1 Tax=unclassified Blastococcus TaxID=2619396 RepID=UPI001EEFE00F|nr:MULTISPECIES: FtsW/RodA/SpoVE family cell cycle protein [unclassified Blastococcus]MCF6508158.1 FtsW/RodA/SpoVE family cell cycle protein [Blastococcus sp. MG754426]MCF6512233.1 FtsW/RodA/SpoVE family cell cycle protein [Blastococcus sp. MG754427]MCF6735812.1 FtsW/RodA/SpoVE family cell cycle protein [Blastococcus sp. KM273129]
MAGPVTDPRAAAAATPTRRGTEALLLAFAVLITVVAQIIVDLTVTGELRPQMAGFSAWITALWVVAHLVVRRWASYADPLLLPSVALLVGLGLAVIHRLDLAAGQVGSTVTREDAPVQLVWATLGVALFVAVLVVVRDHRTLSRFAYTLALIGLVLLAIPAVLPASISEVNGAKIWIRVAGFSIQPGEFAKICLVVFFAAYLVDKRDVLALASKKVAGIELPRGRDLGPVLLAWIVSILVLVFERDLGSSLLLFGIFVVMLYVATERASWLFIGLALFAGGAFIAYQIFAHVQARVNTWLDPSAYYDGAGYQLMQSLFGLGTGGLFGAGLGGGRPDQVPVAKSDFIAAAVGEELGLFGLVAVIVVYLILVERGLRTSLVVRDAFGKLLATGLAFAVAWQVFVVLGGVTGLLPLTGLTTPFLAYGGSSLVANFVLVALLVRISDAARRPAAPHATPVRLGDAPTEVVTP